MLFQVAPVRGEGTLSFDYTLAAEAECAYTFFLDARHSRRADVDVASEESPTVALPEEQQGWSACLEAAAVAAPPAEVIMFSIEQVQDTALPLRTALGLL